MTDPQLDCDSLERIVPETVVAEDAMGSKMLSLHMHRFEFAAKHVLPARLLNVACGVGYGLVPPFVDAKPHNLHDFTVSSFRRLCESQGLKLVESMRQVQKYNPIRIANRSEQRSRDIRPNLGRYYATHPKALLKRLYTTLRHGFANHYLTVAWRLES